MTPKYKWQTSQDSKTRLPESMSGQGKHEYRYKIKNKRIYHDIFSVVIMDESHFYGFSVEITHKENKTFCESYTGIHTSIISASSEFGIYRLCEQRRFRRACASAQSRQNLRCSLIEIVSQEEPSDRKPDP